MSLLDTGLRLLVAACDCGSQAFRNRDLLNENTYLRDALAQERYRVEQLQARVKQLEAEAQSRSRRKAP